MATEVFLRPLKPNDLPEVIDWAHDAEVTRYMLLGSLPLHIIALEKELYENIIFAIWYGNSQGIAHIGNVGLYNVNWVARSAELRIIIGYTDLWGKGIGFEATRKCCDYAFKGLRLNKVWLGSSNPNAVRMFAKAGFIHEGVSRQEVYRDGKYQDAVRMSILRDEYV